MTDEAKRVQPTSVPILLKTVRYGVGLALAIAVIGAVVGFLTAGWPGAVGALLGALIGGVLLAVTALSIVFANRFDVGGFFAIILGAWLLKFVVFIVAALVLRDQPWVEPIAFFLCVIIALIGSLAVDVIVVLRSRMPYVSDPIK